jgi:hypothetical protein
LAGSFRDSTKQWIYENPVDEREWSPIHRPGGRAMYLRLCVLGIVLFSHRTPSGNSMTLFVENGIPVVPGLIIKMRNDPREDEPLWLAVSVEQIVPGLTKIIWMDERGIQNSIETYTNILNTNDWVLVYSPENS